MENLSGWPLPSRFNTGAPVDEGAGEASEDVGVVGAGRNQVGFLGVLETPAEVAAGANDSAPAEVGGSAAAT